MTAPIIDPVLFVLLLPVFEQSQAIRGGQPSDRTTAVNRNNDLSLRVDNKAGCVQKRFLWLEKGAGHAGRLVRLEPIGDRKGQT